ncbi:MAG: host attachment protein [Halioglobus sp.]|nr:host attachment protein [Halioglobus sp.]
METRVIVANNARARIFASHDVLNHLEEQEDFVHTEAHLSNQELVSDAPGKSRNPHGSLDPETSPKEHEAQEFARLLAARLKQMHNERHFEQLFLIAPPAFLGLLRKSLHKTLDKLVERTIDTDLTDASVDKIIDYIRS